MREVYKNILLVIGWLLLAFSFYLFLLAFIEEHAFFIGLFVLAVGLLCLFILKKIENHSGNLLSLYDR